MPNKENKEYSLKKCLRNTLPTSLLAQSSLDAVLTIICYLRENIVRNQGMAKSSGMKLIPAK